MHNLYSICIVSMLSVGLIHDVKAYPVDGRCGLVGRRNPRVINGVVAEDFQFPWIASIKRNGVHICGGSIISSRFILSAAHCFDSFERYSWSFTVTLGEYDQSVNETFSETYSIKRMIKHNMYGSRNSLTENDIALVELSKDIEWSEHIQPICLPKENFNGGEAIAPGWGFDHLMLNVTDDDNNKLRYVEIDIFENEVCNEIYRDRGIMNINLVKTHMCAGKLHGEIRDTIDGDSGGPLLVSREGKHIILGITSCSVGDDIHPRPPGLYTRVFEYMNWIMENIHEVHYYPPALTNNLE